MRVLVVSDSHGMIGRLGNILMAAEAEGPLDAVIHLGDGYCDLDEFAQNGLPPRYQVAGNCDLCRDCPRELRQTMDGVRLLAVHGDRYNVKLELTTLSYYAEEACAQAALFGHTHQPFAGYVGRVLLVNPGSLAQGRYAEPRLDHGQAVPFLKEF